MVIINDETYYEVGMTVRVKPKLAQFGSPQIWGLFKDRDLVVTTQKLSSMGGMSFPVVMVKDEFNRDRWIRAKFHWFDALTIQYEDAMVFI